MDDSKGMVNSVLVKVQMDAMKTIEGRLLGAPIQRSENKNLSVAMSEPRIPLERKKQLEARIAEIKASAERGKRDLDSNFLEQE
jgi:hypothetical protein